METTEILELHNGKFMVRVTKTDQSNENFTEYFYLKNAKKSPHHISKWWTQGIGSLPGIYDLCTFDSVEKAKKKLNEFYKFQEEDKKHIEEKERLFSIKAVIKCEKEATNLN